MCEGCGSGRGGERGERGVRIERRGWEEERSEGVRGDNMFPRLQNCPSILNEEQNEKN